MPYLLDTHILLFWYDNPKLLSDKARAIIENPNNVVFISSVSTWEIAIKKSLGKLNVPDRLFDLVKNGDFLELPITIAHTKKLLSLPDHHRDPFDRLLIAQAMEENATFITRDEKIIKYKIKTIRA